MTRLPTGENPHTPDGAPADPEFVVYRLEEAGAALLALPSTGYTTRLRTSALDVVRDTVEAFSAAPGRVRPAAPGAARITRMDEALGWIARIPAERYVLKRIVGARSLVSPVTERHLFTWRRLATTLGADHKAVQRWHAQGIAMIVASLNTAEAMPDPARPAMLRAANVNAGPGAVSAAGLALRRARAGS